VSSRRPRIATTSWLRASFAAAAAAPAPRGFIATVAAPAEGASAEVRPTPPLLSPRPPPLPLSPPARASPPPLTFLPPASIGSRTSTARCKRVSSGPGSTPRASTDVCRACPNAFSAPSTSPSRYSASISAPHRRSRNGWSAVSILRSATRCGPVPTSSRASTQSSIRARRSSSNEASRRSRCPQRATSSAAAPHTQRRLQVPGRPAGVTGAQRVSALPGQPPELREIQLALVGVHDVAGVPALDPGRAALVDQQGSQARGVGAVRPPLLAGVVSRLSASR
jgi:hypothetical protein